MSGPAFQVDSAALGAHADALQHVGEGLGTAADAARIVQTDAGAYGQLCQFVPALLNQLQHAMVDGIATAATSAHETADALRAIATAYDNADRASADRLWNTR